MQAKSIEKKDGISEQSFLNYFAGGLVSRDNFIVFFL